MLIPFGILSAAGAGVAEGTYELISTTILGTNAASVTFSSLGDYASSYKHLQIRITARSHSGGNAFEIVGMYLNGATTPTALHDILGNGSSVISQAVANSGYLVAAYVTGSASTTNAFGAGVVDIVDAFSTTKNKTLRSLHGRSPATNPVVALSSGALFSTGALTSIQLFGFFADFAAGSRFSLYGIRG